MSRVLQKNKPVASAASQDFINAILCDGLLILSKKYDNQVLTVATGHIPAAPARRMRPSVKLQPSRSPSDEPTKDLQHARA
jgi:hypothetical protein